MLQNDIGNGYAGITVVAAIPARVKDLPMLADVEPGKENGLRLLEGIEGGHTSVPLFQSRLGNTGDCPSPRLPGHLLSQLPHP